MEAGNDIMSEHYMTTNYHPKRMNVDPERNKINMDKTRKSDINVACDHYRVTDKCQIRNISYEELTEFRERYWNCSGTINKRIFMATHLEVDRIDNDNKKDINITCYCPRNDGTLDMICQKSFMSVLGISKHKVLGIGHAKLVNSECLYKEKRNSNRWKPNKNKYDSGLNHSNENSQNHSNLINENDSTMGSNMSESGTIIMKRKLKYLNNNEDNGESNKSSESNKTAQHQKKDNKVTDENNEDDNAIFEPQVKKTKTDSAYVIDDDNECDPANVFRPVVELVERSQVRDEIARRPQLEVRRPNPNSPGISPRNSDGFPTHMIRKQSAYESPEERMAAREKARAILENLHSQVTMSRMRRPPQFNPPSYHHSNQISRPSQPMHPSWQSRPLNYPSNFAGHRNYPQAGYMGPENWQRTLERNIERNIRRRQRMQEVKIDCNHNLTRFCKVISIPQEDLVQFHNMYWNCQGLVEERIFLARFMVVTPCNHRREMAIATRIPTSDGQLVEVCQKSFLSVVGITKHKVQAAARAKLKGTLFRGDGRGGFQKPRSLMEQSEEYPPKMQISNVMERYQHKESKPKGFKNNETIEIADSDEELDNAADTENSSYQNINFEDSQTGNGEEDEDDDSQMLSVEDAFASGKLNYDEFRQNIAKNRINERQKVQITRLKLELNLYKRRAKKLMLERKHFIVKLTKLSAENIKLRKKQKKLNENSNEKVNDKNSLKDDLKQIEENQNELYKTDSIEQNKMKNLNSKETQSKDEGNFIETNTFNNENIKTNEISETNHSLNKDLSNNEKKLNENNEIS